MPRSWLCVVAVIALTAPTEARAQGPGDDVRSGVLVGGRVGFDLRNEALVLGAQSHLLLDPWGVTALMPNAEVAFLSGITEYQLNADAAAVLFQGLYFGGGAAFRNTVFEGPEREWRTGYNLFVGFRSPLRREGLSTQLELRWTFVEEFRPRIVSVGVNVPVAVF